MARSESAEGWPRALARLCVAARRAAAVATVAAAAALAPLLPSAAQADPVKGDATLSASGGFARLVIRLDDDVESEVNLAGSIVVIRFKKPVDIAVGKLADAVPDYVGSARRDPDGMAIRLALARKVTVNSMMAGERTFIDLLPESWNGPPPSLPQEVVRNLAERAREAERELRQQKGVVEAKKRAPVRVRASVQPTFVRFVFDLPPGVGASSSLEDKQLSLVFTAPLSFDLADAKVSAPTNIGAIEQKIEGTTTRVTLATIGEVDVHSFREDASYVVDIGFSQARKPPATASHPAEPKPAPAAAMSKPAAAEASEAHNAPPPPPLAAAANDIMEQVKAAAAETHGAPAPAAPAAKSPEPAPKSPDKGPEKSPDKVTEEHPAPPPPAPAAAPAPAPSAAVSPQVQAAAPAHAGPPASAPAPATAASPAPPVAAGPARTGTVTVSAKRSSDGLRLIFPFLQAQSVAMFRRGEAVWLVFDDDDPINVDAIRREGGSIVADVSLMAIDGGQALRIRLNRPQLASLFGDGSDLTVTFADTIEAPSQALSAVRNITDPTRAHVAIALPNPGEIHRIVDPDAGDQLTVVTAPLPARGFIKSQRFVEFSLLETIHGVVLQSDADDLSVTTNPDKVVISRPGGLTLSSADIVNTRAANGPRPIFDPTDWRENHDAPFTERLDALIEAAARMPEDGRVAANIDLARFYLARGFFPEARAASNLALAEAKPGSEDPAALIIRAIANVMSNRPADALRDLANPLIGSAYDLQVWKGLAYARQEKWPEAREKFKNAEFSVAALPEDLQRAVLASAMRASLEVHDYAGASARSNDLDIIGVPAEMKPMVKVMRGQLAEAMGHEKEALEAYDEVVASDNRPAAAKANLLQLLLRQKRNEIGGEDLTAALETQEMTWRGDTLEMQTLGQLTRIYADTNRPRDAFKAARAAMQLQPNSEVSRQIQDESSALFAKLFLGNKGDDLSPVEALGLFYDFRELTPIGRRGDELIRRLAERLVGIDLLDQAADLLQYQVDHRLEGAARAQVASRLATIYLMNRKPDRAASVLRGTRISDLAGELRQQRLLLEARAQSDIGRHDLALDIISNLTGREVVRLRSDIYWAARRWRESAEQIELYYGERWKDFQPLDTAEKGDIIRAAIGYALAEDGIGSARLREKYGPKMSEGADRVAFDIASQPATASSAEFAQIAKMAASVDTLDGFLREMKARFPETMAKAGPPAADPNPTGSLPVIARVKQAVAH
ncbi:MAG: tetratricopeptide repeat protein [Xanthobacteraceae bacterium]|nr:tetratricopeptide repeat protein [Xanthobacteraceae bacterium]